MATDEGKEGHAAADFVTEHKEDHRHETQELNAHSVALAAALAEQKPNPWSRNMMKLYAIMGLGYLISTMNGYDSSLMGSINAMIPYQETFGLDGAGSSTGMVFIIYNLGQIAAFPICGLLADGYGRRWCIFVGCLIVLIGTAVQATANTLGHFIGGRFILGFGASVASAAGPAYTVELAHPAYRGFMAGMYNNLWWLGNIIAGWATYGSNLHFTSSWAWRVPTIVQAGMPGIAMVVILFFPESPRWLIAQDRTEEALQVMAKYHGDGNVNHPIVQLQYREIVEQNNMYRSKVEGATRALRRSDFDTVDQPTSEGAQRDSRLASCTAAASILAAPSSSRLDVNRLPGAAFELQLAQPSCLRQLVSRAGQSPYIIGHHLRRCRGSRATRHHPHHASYRCNVASP